ncbi:MAG: MDR family MFS transporter [Armatimonadota bacterium]|nr:MDR family MFS transporter [Armatimonadota bacterium]MDR7548745.1 MDR family MFS transporter [Armatimonadota bacterium]
MNRSKVLITLGVMLSLFLASMEATVVATGMPTIVSQLGGLDIYSWVFSAYMLAATATVPIFGKLSDLFGRRPVYLVAMGLFLAGSLLCGLAQSMAQLIAFRIVQGLGAGGVLPLAFVIVGALFSFEQRAKVQGVFAGVWGISSLVGPLLGGFLVDQVSWRWIFYINLVPGLLAAALIGFVWVDEARPAGAGAVSVDYAGAILLSMGVAALLLGLFEVRTPVGRLLLVLAAGAFAVLWRVEHAAADPVLPLRLFRDRLFAAASAHGVLAGCAVFGGVAFVPLFVQAVMGTSATAAGATLMPLMLGWVAASIIGSRLLLVVGYRPVAVTGMASLTIGTFLMAQIGEQTGHGFLLASLALMGIGMGLSVPSLMIAVQTAVARHDLGTATSTLQFMRSIGGAVGVSVMGLVLSLRLAGTLAAAGADPAAVSLNRLLDPLVRASAATGLEAVLRAALAGAIRGVFIIAFVTAAAGLAATALAPRGRIAQLAAARAEATATSAGGK